MEKSMWGPWILSIIAIIQVWIIKLVDRLRKGNVEIYETSNVELGFGGYGPTVALVGTLQALQKDLFIKNMAIKVTRLSDNSNHDFSWLAFRPSTISLTGQDSGPLEVPSGFLLTTQNPKKYNIIFNEQRFIEEMRPKSTAVGRAWYEYVKNEITVERGEQHYNYSQVMQDSNFAERLYSAFSDTNATTELYTYADRGFYWIVGEYVLELVVETANPTQRFSKQWHFNINEEDERNLRLNSIAILRATCDLTVYWNFAYPQYQNIGV